MHSKCLWSALVVSACLAVACSEEMTRVEPEAAATALPEGAVLGRRQPASSRFPHVLPDRREVLPR